VRAKAARTAMPINTGRLQELATFREFDDQVTAPLHGFRDVDDYYQRSSSRQFIKHIRCPTLILHARNDPFMTPEAIPSSTELGPEVRLEVSSSGGHVGFVSGRWPWQPVYWLDKRVCYAFKSRELTTM